jgi:2-dehydropantoate 2-reductase
LLRRDGLIVKSPNGDVSVMPHLATADTLDGAYDAILLAVKAFGLSQAMEDMAPAMGPQTIILPVLNGMRHVDLLSERFGAKAVGGCVCKIAVDLDAQGHVLQLMPQEDMAYGEMDGSNTDRMKALDVFMRDAGFPARLSPTIAREMWEKWILLAGLGGINALMRGSIGEVEAASGGRDFALAYLEEIIAVISAVGLAPGEKFVQFARQALTAKGSPMTSSMYRDLQKGSAVEADSIIGDLLVRAKAAGIAMPLTAAVYANLCVYQNRLNQGARTA